MCMAMTEPKLIFSIISEINNHEQQRTQTS